MDNARIATPPSRNPRARRLPRMAALGLALGLCALAPCCPAPAPTAQADPGVTVTGPATQADPGTTVTGPEEPVGDAGSGGAQGGTAEGTGVPSDGPAAPAGSPPQGTG